MAIERHAVSYVLEQLTADGVLTDKAAVSAGVGQFVRCVLEG